MKTMHLYHISYLDQGKIVHLIPKLPEKDFTLPDEENTRPRICASTSIYGCVNALELFWNEKIKKEGKLNFYVYEAEVPVGYIYQPCVHEVQDSWFTNELWVTRSFNWTRIDEYVIEEGNRCDYQFEIGEICTYYVHPINEDRFDAHKPENALNLWIDGDSDNFVFVASTYIPKGETK